MSSRATTWPKDSGKSDSGREGADSALEAGPRIPGPEVSDSAQRSRIEMPDLELADQLGHNFGRLKAPQNPEAPTPSALQAKLQAAERAADLGPGGSAHPEAAPGIPSRQDVLQAKLGFEFQVMNEFFFDEEDKLATEKKSIARIGRIGIERDGANPEFVTDAFDENTDRPRDVEEAVSPIIEDYDQMIGIILLEDKTVHMLPPGERDTVKTVDAQATGGFNLSEVFGWYRTLESQRQPSDLKKGQDRFSDKLISPFQKRDIQRDTAHQRRGKRTEANYRRLLAATRDLPPDATRAVAGLMVLINTNIQAIAATVTGDRYAPGVKALTSIIPKSNLSSLYSSMDTEDKLNFQMISERIKEDRSHPWHQPVVYDVEDKKSSKLGWEYIHHWTFYPHLYMDDIIAGVEPMWVFEGFSEVNAHLGARAGMLGEVEEKVGLETARDLGSERAKPAKRWAARGIPLDEAIIEMRELGYGDLPLEKIVIYATEAFVIYQEFKRSG